MRRLGISIGLLLLACASALPENVVVTEYPRSSPKVRLRVLLKGEGAPKTAVIFHRFDGNQESEACRRKTDARARVSSPALQPGNYRIVARSGKREATLFIEVKRGEKHSAFDMDLVRVNGLEAAERAPSTASVNDFHGVVFDQGDAAIPQAKIQVYRQNDLDNAPVLELFADEEGQFSGHLESGIYVAVFNSQGFARRVLVFEVTSKGDTGLHVTLEVGHT